MAPFLLPQYTRSQRDSGAQQPNASRGYCSACSLTGCTGAHSVDERGQEDEDREQEPGVHCDVFHELQAWCVREGKQEVQKQGNRGEDDSQPCEGDEGDHPPRSVTLPCVQGRHDADYERKNRHANLHDSGNRRNVQCRWQALQLRAHKGVRNFEGPGAQTENREDK